MTLSIERGQVYWVELDPTVGAEMAKRRPCVVMSASEINLHRKTVVVIPLTTTATTPTPPLLVAVPSAGASSKARIEHIRAVDKSRFQNKLGALAPKDMQMIEDALRRVVRLPNA